MRELQIATWLRKIAIRYTDDEIEQAIKAFATIEVQRVLSLSGRFNWHSRFVLGLLREPRINSLVLRALFR